MTTSSSSPLKLAPGLVVGICFFIAALEGYDIQAFGVSAPHMAPELKLGPEQMGLAGSAAMLGLMLGALGGGWLADRVGRKPVLAGSVLAFGLFSILTALAHNFETLTLARLATGIGFGGAMPNLIAVATEISPPEKRIATTTSMFCGLPAGGALVALFARWGGESLDWRTLFFIGGVLPILLVPVILTLLPETRPEPDPAEDHNLVRGLFGGGRIPATLLIWLIFGLDLLVTYLLLNWLPTLVIAKGFTAADGATASLWQNVASVVGALILGRLSDRYGSRWLLIGVFALLALAMSGLSAATTMTGVAIYAAAAGFTVVGGLYVLYGVAPTYYPPHVRAMGVGAAIAVGRLGSIIGPLLAGDLKGMGYSAAQILMAMVPLVILTVVAIFALGRIRPYGAPPAAGPQAGS